jgi:uncharacterized protein (TIGR03435 family)
MTPLAAAVTTALLHSIWQDAIVAAVLGIALLVLRGARPHVRYIVACAALVLMTLLPVATAMAVRTAPTSALVQATDVRTLTMTAASPADLIVPLQPASEQLWLATARAWVFPLWCVGVLLFSVRLAGSAVHAVSLTRRGTAADRQLRERVCDIARRMGVTGPVAVVVPAAAHVGVATVGWLRPVILVPASALVGLTSGQLEALIAHEVAHIRRHDYLVNLAQLVVETIGFYHPAVWWVSHRIRIERELCCDDAAVEACGDADGYARALATKAGARPQPALAAAGGSLRERIERLLEVSNQKRRAPAGGGLLALALVCLITAGGSWMYAQQPSAGRAPVSFEVASIRANTGATPTTPIRVDTFGKRFVATNVPVRTLVRLAYGLEDHQIAGGPPWMNEARFDITANADRDLPPMAGPFGAGGALPDMIKSLLAQRFGFAAHNEMRDASIFQLTLARADGRLGDGLKRSTMDCPALFAQRKPDDGNPACGLRLAPGSIVLEGMPISQLAAALTELLRRAVVDRTGLQGTYDLQLHWSPRALDPTDAAAQAAQPDAPSLFTALPEQAGLRLESVRGQQQVLIVDNLQRPTPN